MIYIASLISGRQRKRGPRKNFSSDTANVDQVCTLTIEMHPLNTRERRKVKISKEKLPPPY